MLIMLGLIQLVMSLFGYTSMAISDASYAVVNFYGFYILRPIIMFLGLN